MSRLPFFVPAPDDTIATLDGQPILASAVLGEARATLRYYDEREAEEMRWLRSGERTPTEAREFLEDFHYGRYNAIRMILEDYLMKVLMENDARRKGVGIDNIFDELEVLRDPPATPEEIDRFLRDRSIDKAKLTETELASVPDIIRSNRVWDARSAYMRKLRADANVEILLIRPGTSYAPVEIKKDQAAGSGPIIVTVVTDFECPYSKRRVADVHSWATKNPDVTVTIKHLPLESIHPYARRAAVASTCAAKQGKFWPYHDWLFVQQEQLMGEDEEFEAGAQALGLDIDRFRDCLDAPSAAAEINEDLAWARALGVRSTPSFFVNGYRAQDSAHVSDLITEARQRLSAKSHK